MENQRPNQVRTFEAFPVPGYVAANHPQNNLRDIGQTSAVNKVKAGRQTSQATREQTIAKYKADLSDVWIDETTTKQHWFGTLTLDCKVLDPNQLPTGVQLTKEGKYQYNFTDPELDPEDKGKRYRPNAYRMPYLMHEQFRDKAMSVSHLCHNNACHNWEHTTLEQLHVNKARNGCPGGHHCHHQTKCLIPGPYFNA